jgi:hypothetical protein
VLEIPVGGIDALKICRIHDPLGMVIFVPAAKTIVFQTHPLCGEIALIGV